MVVASSRGDPRLDVWEGIVEGFRVKFIEMGKLIIGVAIDIGPRILYLASREDPGLNLFGVVPEIEVLTEEGMWRIYGGHRLWTSPEAMPRSYSLDDKPVEFKIKSGEVVIEGNPEPLNMVRKRIAVKAEGEGLSVTHEIFNIGRWPIEFSCWALTVMKPGGFAIIPIKPRCVDKGCLLPDRKLVLWPYTRPTDSRLLLLDSYIVVKNDPSARKPLKIGVNANPQWAAYWVDGYLFLKGFAEEATSYPDHGSSVEVYTSGKVLELETLGPLKRVEPGYSNTHREFWLVARVGGLEPIEDQIEKVVSKISENITKHFNEPTTVGRD